MRTLKTLVTLLLIACAQAGNDTVGIRQTQDKGVMDYDAGIESEAESEAESEGELICEIPCDDGDLCTTDTCENGICLASPIICDDASVCTIDTCTSGSCVFPPITCDDNNECTENSCEVVIGCLFTPNRALCDDNNLCTLEDICDQTACAGTPLTCNRPPVSECVDSLTQRTYAAEGSCSDGTCAYVATETPCNDSDPCTIDRCSEGVCAADPVQCNTPPPDLCLSSSYLLVYSTEGTCASGVCEYAVREEGECPSFLNARGACLSLTDGVTCSYVCDEGHENCDIDLYNGCEVVLASDVNHCGGCNERCTSPEYSESLCRDSTCGFTCYTDYILCPDGVTCCSLGQWATVSTTSAPTGRRRHTAIWTGSEMIVWGGIGLSSFRGDGKRYNPITNTWSTMTSTNAPSSRELHTAIWTGSEMVVFGGYNAGGTLGTGGRYDPVRDRWNPVWPVTADNARLGHTAVWTGTEMLIWGGDNLLTGPLNTGLRYIPETDLWSTMTTVGAPTGRSGHTAVWTGSEMIVWGNSPAATASGYGTGGRYDPVNNSWEATDVTPTEAPVTRNGHTAIWTGTKMVVWGGSSLSGTITWYRDTGGQYDPILNEWLATSTEGVPLPRANHTAIWTGSEMIVWGGRDELNCLNAGRRYDPTREAWSELATTNVPGARHDHTAIWTGSEMIVWGGQDGISVYLNTGGRYTPP